MSVLNARTVAPFAAMGITWAARKGMTAAYAKRTGHVPPQPDDVEVSLTKVLAWTIATAIVSAAIQVTITRLAAQYSEAHDDIQHVEDPAITA